MSGEKYVPDHEMVRESWIEWCASCGIGRATAYEEFERYIDEIKANVLREFGEKLAGTRRRIGDEVKELANSAAEHIERAANE